jgi:hypothetical protein
MAGWWVSRWGWATAVVAAVTVIVIVTTSRVELLLPNLVAGHTNAFSLAYVVAFVPGLWWIVVCGNRPIAAEATSTRRSHIAGLDLLLAFAPVAVASGILILFGDALFEGAARNLVLVAAISLVAAETLPRQFALLAPVGYLLAAGTSGFEYRAPRPNGWALVLDQWLPERDLPIVVVSAAVAGSVLFAARLRGQGKSQSGH